MINVVRIILLPLMHAIPASPVLLGCLHALRLASLLRCRRLGVLAVLRGPPTIPGCPVLLAGAEAGGAARLVGLPGARTAGTGCWVVDG